MLAAVGGPSENMRMSNVFMIAIVRRRSHGGIRKHDRCARVWSPVSQRMIYFCVMFSINHVRLPAGNRRVHKKPVVLVSFRMAVSTRSALMVYGKNNHGRTSVADPSIVTVTGDLALRD